MHTSYILDILFSNSSWVLCFTIWIGVMRAKGWSFCSLCKTEYLGQVRSILEISSFSYRDVFVATSSTNLICV